MSPRSPLPALAVTLAALAAAAPSDARRLTLPAPSPGDLVAAGALAEAAPVVDADRQPVAVAWPLAAGSPLATAVAPFVAESREHWFRVTAAELEAGVEPAIASRGALLRLSPLAAEPGAAPPSPPASSCPRGRSRCVCARSSAAVRSDCRSTARPRAGRRASWFTSSSPTARSFSASAPIARLSRRAIRGSSRSTSMPAAASSRPTRSSGSSPRPGAASKPCISFRVRMAALEPRSHRLSARTVVPASGRRKSRSSRPAKPRATSRAAPTPVGGATARAASRGSTAGPRGPRSRSRCPPRVWPESSRSRRDPRRAGSRSACRSRWRVPAATRFGAPSPNAGATAR